MALALLKTLAVLAAVLALILALAYAAKRLRLVRGPAASRTGWRVVATKTLAPRRQLMLMEIGSSLLLLGVTDKSIRALLEIRDPLECQRLLEALEPRKEPSSSFFDILRNTHA